MICPSLIIIVADSEHQVAFVDLIVIEAIRRIRNSSAKSKL